MSKMTAPTTSLTDITRSSYQNEKTIEAYDHEVDRYINNTPQTYNKSHQPMLRWLNAALEILPAQAKILEIGSGTGREARYIKKQGHNILCSDAADSFVEYLHRNQIDAFKLNILTDKLPVGFDMIVANAVVPHFTPDDLKIALTKIEYSLSAEGIFALSAKQGVGETWINEKLKRKRYIHFWQPSLLIQFLESAGFEIVFMESNTFGDFASHIWTHIIVRKTK